MTNRLVRGIQARIPAFRGLGSWSVHLLEADSIAGQAPAQGLDEGQAAVVASDKCCLLGQIE